MHVCCIPDCMMYAYLFVDCIFLTPYLHFVVVNLVAVLLIFMLHPSSIGGLPRPFFNFCIKWANLQGFNLPVCFNPVSPVYLRLGCGSTPTFCHTNHSITCCSLAFLSLADSASNPHLIHCNLVSFDSVASWSRPCCRHASLCSTVWAA